MIPSTRQSEKEHELLALKDLRIELHSEAVVLSNLHLRIVVVLLLDWHFLRLHWQS